MKKSPSIHFEKLTAEHLATVLSWLEHDFVKEFWDSTQVHKDDMQNFVLGRKSPSDYVDGKYVYWIAFGDHVPFAMIMIIQDTLEDDLGPEKLAHLSKTGHTYSIDYMIGNSSFFGKGYGARTLSAFLDYFRTHIDPQANTFLIDPACDNPRAKHVYMKTGFHHVCDFLMTGNYSGSGKMHHLLVKRF